MALINVATHSLGAIAVGSAIVPLTIIVVHFLFVEEFAETAYNSFSDGTFVIGPVGKDNDSIGILGPPNDRDQTVSNCVIIGHDEFLLFGVAHGSGRGLSQVKKMGSIELDGLNIGYESFLLQFG